MTPCIITRKHERLMSSSLPLSLAYPAQHINLTYLVHGVAECVHEIYGLLRNELSHMNILVVLLSVSAILV